MAGVRRGLGNQFQLLCGIQPTEEREEPGCSKSQRQTKTLSLGSNPWSVGAEWVWLAGARMGLPPCSTFKRRSLHGLVGSLQALLRLEWWWWCIQPGLVLWSLEDSMVLQVSLTAQCVQAAHSFSLFLWTVFLPVQSVAKKKGFRDP